MKQLTKEQAIAESDGENIDEKVRKALIKLVTNHASMDLFIEYDIHLDEALTWLEKQSEQKPVDSTFEIKPKFKQGDIIKEKETGNLFYVNSVEDFGYTLHYKNCIAKGCTMSFKYEDNYELVEQAPAWSKEDEKMLYHIICDIESIKEELIYCKPICDEEINWLKSLKYRIVPQPKQVLDFLDKLRTPKDKLQPKYEWSEEDESLRRRCIGAIDMANLSDYTKDNLLNWLKSLKERYIWKPSDEQMEALWAATESYLESDNEKVIELRGKVLESLYNDLKKLREE